MKVSNSFAYTALAALVLVCGSASAQTADAPAAAPVEGAAPTDGSVVDPAAVDPNAVPAEGDVLAEEVPVEAGIAEVTEESVENPYGLEALWNDGGVVSRTTLGILVVMSVGSWYIFITKMLTQSSLLGQAGKAGKKFWSATSLREAVDNLDSNSVFRKVALDGLNAAEHHQKHLSSEVSLYEWVGAALRRSVDEVNGRLQGGNAVLATVGSISPFVGLFGTVWGILQALISIGVAGQASIDKVAGPVGEALIMTAIGLAVAVPAVGFYNIVIRRNKQIVESLRRFSDDVEAYIVSGSRIGADMAKATAKRKA